ncbi:MAG: 4-(cytidine 5'-diphospho)-2-C-methyl-D-erythritol kinase [Pseudomonadota bacterium]
MVPLRTLCVPAKVNLALHVTGRRSDGYHLLDTLVAYTDAWFDTVSVVPAKRISLKVSGDHAEGVPTDDRNLVVRALKRLATSQAVEDGLSVSLDKGIPVASGLGGGTGDAAAALILARDAWGLTCDLADHAAAIGADGPMCLHGCAVGGVLRATGAGEALETQADLPACGALLVNPGVPVETAAVFRYLERRDEPPIPALNWADGFDALIDGLQATTNSLEEPAIRTAPEIGQVLETLNRLPRCRIARMSGSGATCFGLFDHEGEAREAAALVSAAQPGWHVGAGDFRPRTSRVS